MLELFSPETLRWFFGGLFVLVGWILRSFYGDLRDLAKEITAVKLTYVQKEDYKVDMKEIKDTLIRIEAKIDSK